MTETEEIIKLLKEMRRTYEERFALYIKHLEEINEGQKEILSMLKSMAVKEDVKDLGKTIDMYMEYVKVYIERQKMLAEEIEIIQARFAMKMN